MKIFKSRIFFFILGLMIASTTTYALAIASKDVSYDNTTSGAAKTNVQEAIDELYVKFASFKKLNVQTTAGAGDILSGKTAYNTNGNLITGTYAIPPMTAVFQIGSNNSGSTRQQTRINMRQYANIYKYFKITVANCATPTANNCSTIYFNSVGDQTSGNMSLNVQYSTYNYPNFVVYTTGSTGYFYDVHIYLYN